MYCSKCGMANKDNAKFCAKCGSKFEEKHEPEHMEVKEEIQYAKLKKIKRGKSSKIFFVFVMFIGFGALAIYWYFSPEQKIVRAFQDRKYEEVATIYHGSSDIDSVLIIEFVKEALEELREKYVSKELQYDMVDVELNAIEQMKIMTIEDYLKQTREVITELHNSRSAFEAAETKMESNDFENAIELYKKVIPKDENYDIATKQLALAIDRYRNQVLLIADEYMSNNEFVQADLTIENALSTLDEDVKVLEKQKVIDNSKKEYDKKNSIENIHDCVANDNWEKAFEEMHRLLEYMTDDIDVRRVYESYYQQYVEFIIIQAERLADDKKYTEAIDKLDEGIKVVGDNAYFTEMKEGIQEKKPVNITDLSVLYTFGNGWSWNKGNPIDSFGNDYSSASNYAICANNSYIKGDCWSVDYRIYKQYETITGTIVPYADMGSNSQICLKIYGDEALLYTSPAITLETEVFDFCVEVEGVDYLRIRVDEYDDSYEGMLIVSDVTLNKE